MATDRVRDLETSLAALTATLKAERRADQRLEKARRLALEESVKVAKETETTHFEGLNKANERSVTERAQFLQTERFEGYEKATEQRLRKMENELLAAVSQKAFDDYRAATASALTAATKVGERDQAGRDSLRSTGMTIYLALVGLGAVVSMVVTLANAFSTPHSSPSTVVPVLAVPSVKP